MRIPLPSVDDDAAGSTTVSFDDGEALVRQGGAADHVLVLTSGAARVETAEGVVLDTLGPGDLVGEMSILAGGTRTANVTAVDRVTARRFDRVGFIQLLESHPQLRAAVAGEVSRRLDEHHILLHPRTRLECRRSVRGPARAPDMALGESR